MAKVETLRPESINYVKLYVITVRHDITIPMTEPAEDKRKCKRLNILRKQLPKQNRPIATSYQLSENICDGIVTI